MAKQQINIQLDSNDAIEEMILEQINATKGNRQPLLRDFCKLGVLAREAGFLIHKGKLMHEQSFSAVSSLVRAPEVVHVATPSKPFEVTTMSNLNQQVAELTGSASSTEEHDAAGDESLNNYLGLAGR